MSQIEDLLKKNGFTMDDVRKFAEENYPQFASNLNLIAKLFLIQKGININPPTRMKGPKLKINQLQPNENAVVDVVLVQEIETRSYIGCPKCFRKLPVLGETECPKDGIVISENLQWRTFLTGDDTGEMIVTFAPTIKQDLKPGMTVTIRGTLSEKNGEFTAFNIITGEEATVEVPAQQPVVSGGVKCPVCGKLFKDETGLKVHMKLVHKMAYQPQTQPVQSSPPVQTATESTTSQPVTIEVKPVEQPKVEQPKPEQVKPPEQADIKPEAIRLAKVYGLLKKPLADFQEKLSKEFPGVPVEKVLELASVKVDQDNKLYVVQ